MGRVRTKTVKRAAKILLEKHYQKLTNDFHINKRILSDVAKVPTKKLRNKIAGFATHLVQRIQRGPVKGISLKVQEEERERRLDWVPKESEIDLMKVKLYSCRSLLTMKPQRCSRNVSVRTFTMRLPPSWRSRLPRFTRKVEISRTSEEIVAMEDGTRTQGHVNQGRRRKVKATQQSNNPNRRQKRLRKRSQQNKPKNKREKVEDAPVKDNNDRIVRFIKTPSVSSRSYLPIILIILE